MRVCLIVGMVLLGGFLSSDLAVISWAMNIVCSVTVGSLGASLRLLFLRQLRFALLLRLCGVGGSFVWWCVVVWRC
jgi:hypothetical protein